MSGVNALLTSTLSIISVGKKSNAVARLVVSSSAVGIRSPFKEAELHCAGKPRTATKRPSPWSRSIDTPGKRCTASAALRSGSFPMPSAEIAFTIRFELR